MGNFKLLGEAFRMTSALDACCSPYPFARIEVRALWRMSAKCFCISLVGIIISPRFVVHFMATTTVVSWQGRQVIRYGRGVPFIMIIGLLLLRTCMNHT